MKYLIIIFVLLSGCSLTGSSMFVKAVIEEEAASLLLRAKKEMFVELGKLGLNETFVSSAEAVREKSEETDLIQIAIGVITTGVAGLLARDKFNEHRSKNPGGKGKIENSEPVS